MGEGDTGQLGLGPDIMEKVKPAKVALPKDNVVQVYAGGMHTVCLTDAGEVSTGTHVGNLFKFIWLHFLVLSLMLIIYLNFFDYISMFDRWFI